MDTHLELRDQILRELKKILIDTFCDTEAKVYLFGSWARNEEKQSSDIDIAVEGYRQFSPSKWQELNDRVEESLIPYYVDIVDLENASKELIQNVKKEGILWKDFNNELNQQKGH